VKKLDWFGKKHLTEAQRHGELMHQGITHRYVGRLLGLLKQACL